MSTETRSPFLLRADEIKAQTTQHSHPMNPNSEIHGVLLAKALGLQRIGVNIARIPPGKESFIAPRVKPRPLGRGYKRGQRQTNNERKKEAKPAKIKRVRKSRTAGKAGIACCEPVLSKAQKRAKALKANE